eukprot:gene17188-22707_t
MLLQTDKETWGEATNEQKTEFIQSLDNFSKGLQGNIKSLNSGFELKCSEDRIETLGNAAASDPILVTKATNILNEWCLKIEKYLDDSDRHHWEDPDAGPDTELEYWKGRMHRLISITEQLKTKSVRSVVGLLNHVSRMIEVNPAVDQRRIISLITQWREVDIQITEAANESKDNEVREKESSIGIEVNPILDMYNMLEYYLPEGSIDKDDIEKKSTVYSTWRKVVDHAESVADSLSAVQGIYKKRLIDDIRDFSMDIKNLRKDFEESGPMLPSMKPLVAIEKLKKFKDELSIRERKMEVYRADTSDTLEMWIKVQLLWTSLESVFLGGDIAKQMPLEAKKFSKINKDWEKLMLRAAETKLVVISCGNELLRTTLPILYSELEKCQKSLEGYLEQKRSKFPRFYFVSNPVLLLILSQGSDPQQMQPYYEKSIMGNSRETISLYNPVKAIGNIEDWLGELEIEMQKSMKRLCELIASECIHSPVRQFVNNSCGQFALLGLQIWWTYHCSEAINKSKTNKQVMTETSRLQVAVLGDLSSWCLEDLGDLFPSLGMPVGQARTALRSALASVCESDNLILHPSWTIKVIQLYETTLVRHGIMMVGPAGSGKSKIISTLQDALTITTGVIHKRSRMNPKAIRAEEMFGETDKVDLDWEPILLSWLNKKPNHLTQIFKSCFKKYIGTCDGPKQFETLYDYYINVYSMEWERWVAPTWEYPYSIEEPDFSSLLVPTIESTKAIYLCNLLHKKGFNILITGANGTAKTSTILMFFDSINSSNNLLPTTASHGNTNPTNKTSSSSNLSSSAHNQGTTSSNLKLKKICFSSLTTPSIFQLSVESELDKRGGKSFGPPSGKKMLLFIDDISMPQVNTWNDQPTLELVRQLIENSGICFLDKDKRGDLKNIEDISYIAAMNHPSGGKQDIPNRLKRHFYSFTMILPSTRAINEIYGQMMAGRYIHESNPYFLSICDLLPKTTVKLWQWMRQKMLPSPTKFHYTFNLRDLSRVFQGILRTPKVSVTDSKHLLLLWRHECERVFSDKLTNDTDKDSFYYQLNYFTEELLSVVNPNNDNISIGTNASIASLSPISRLQNTGIA